MKLRYFLTAVLLLAAVIACEQSNRGNISPAIGEHMQMASFRLESLTDGKVLDSKDLEDQVVLVTFFATWCPPCIQEIPTLKALQDTLGAKGFSVVAFSVDEGDLAPLAKLIEEFEINYPVLLADADIANSFGGVTGIPVTFLVNRQGEVVKKFLGYVGYSVLEEEINAMLDNPPPKSS